jgi:hypothetical protein
MRLKPAIVPMKCRVCGCSENRPCDPACEWTRENLCSTCAMTIAALGWWRQSAVRPSLAALLREYRKYPPLSGRPVPAPGSTRMPSASEKAAR